MLLNPELKTWLKKFHEFHGRPLRVLHIGNIASNAYINAKLQRKIGVDSYLIAETDTYVMNSPEWEDSDFEGNWEDDCNPNWAKIDLKGYKRPEWFISGRLEACLVNITARMCTPPYVPSQVEFLIKGLYITLLFIFSFVFNITFKFFKNLLYIATLFTYNIVFIVVKFIVNIFHCITRTFISLFNLIKGFFVSIIYVCIVIASVLIITLKLPVNKEKIYNKYIKIVNFSKILLKKFLPTTSFLKNALVSFRSYLSNFKLMQNSHTSSSPLTEEFSRLFPDRKDKLTEKDTLPFIFSSHIWKKIFSHFDLVQCYGPHPIWGLLSQNTKYVALEHGTLRDFTLKDNPMHRLIALAYRNAKHTFITNGDCLEYAKKINLENYSAMIHPLDLEPFEKVNQEDVDYIRNQYKADLLLFCPIRHDWEIKGTHIVLQSLPHIIAKTDKSVMLILCEWGQEVNRSKKLINELKIQKYVKWVRPLPKIKLAKYLKAADVILDQMA